MIEDLELEEVELSTELALLEIELLEKQTSFGEKEQHFEELEAYNEWLQQKEQRANQIRDRWDNFENSLTNEQRASILEYMQNNWDIPPYDEENENPLFD